jgi:hypothetical protein
VIAACIEETCERVNENSPDPVSDSEKKAMLIAKVTQADTYEIFAFDVKTISLKVTPPIPDYETVKALLLTAESSHYQNMDPETIVKATFNSFGMKGNNKESHSSKTANANGDCPHCHLPGHSGEECPRYVDCKGCGKVHSKYWKGCPTGNFLPDKKSINSNNNNNSKEAKKQDKTGSSSKKRHLDDNSQKEKEVGYSKKISFANAAKEDPIAVDLAESMSTLHESMLNMTSAVNTLTAQQAKTVKDMEKHQVKTAKLTSRMNQMDESYDKSVQSRSIVNPHKSRKAIKYQDAESTDEDN